LRSATMLEPMKPVAPVTMIMSVLSG